MSEQKRINTSENTGELFTGKSEQTSKLLSAKEVARILGLSESTIREMARDGELGYVQVRPTRRMFTHELVHEFIESHIERASTPRRLTAQIFKREGDQLIEV